MSASVDLSNPSQYWPSIDGIDACQSSQIMGGDRLFFIEILESFIGDQEDFMSQLTALLLHENWDELAKLTHKLAGRAGNIGATHLFESAGELEQAISNKDSDIHEHFNRVAQEYQKIIASITLSIKNQHLTTLPPIFFTTELTLKKLNSHLHELQRMAHARAFNVKAYSRELMGKLKGTSWETGFIPIFSATESLELSKVEILIQIYEKNINNDA